MKRQESKGCYPNICGVLYVNQARTVWSIEGSCKAYWLMQGHLLHRGPASGAFADKDVHNGQASAWSAQHSAVQHKQHSTAQRCSAQSNTM